MKALIEAERKTLTQRIDISLSNDSDVDVRNRFEIVQTNGLLGLILVMAFPQHENCLLGSNGHPLHLNEADLHVALF
jgi:hypothetical protein